VIGFNIGKIKKSVQLQLNKKALDPREAIIAKLKEENTLK
jgi:hypothetical protein